MRISDWSSDVCSSDLHAVHRDHRVVLGDDLLPGNIEHLLHHVHLAADTIEERGVEIESRRRDLGEAAEMLDRVLIALVDDLYARHQVKSTRTSKIGRAHV